MTSLVQEAMETLATSGGRMTAQRRLILEALESLTDHPTAEEIFAVVKPQAPEINLSTVYRTLRWLEQEGLVNSRWFEDQGRQQGRFDACSTHDHHHFVCIQCRSVVEFSNPLLETILEQYEQQFGGKVQEASLLLRGLCPACLKENEAHS